MGVAAHLRHAAQQPMRQDFEGPLPVEGAGFGGAVETSGVFTREKLKAFHAVLELCKGTVEIFVAGNGEKDYAKYHQGDEGFTDGTEFREAL